MKRSHSFAGYVPHCISCEARMDASKDENDAEVKKWPEPAAGVTSVNAHASAVAANISRPRWSTTFSDDESSDFEASGEDVQTSMHYDTDSDLDFSPCSPDHWRSEANISVTDDMPSPVGGDVPQSPVEKPFAAACYATDAAAAFVPQAPTTVCLEHELAHTFTADVSKVSLPRLLGRSSFEASQQQKCLALAAEGHHISASEWMLNQANTKHCSAYPGFDHAKQDVCDVTAYASYAKVRASKKGCAHIPIGVLLQQGVPPFSDPYQPARRSAKDISLKRTTSTPAATLEVEQPPQCQWTAASSSVADVDEKGPVPAPDPPAAAAPFTTVMIRNLPGQIIRSNLLEELDRSGFTDQYDFCYMPCDFDSGQAKHMAFVNFTFPQAAASFTQMWNGSRRFGMFPDQPAISICKAVVQGKESNLKKWTSVRMKRVRNPELLPFVK